ncbi:MAG: ACP S-malonyltransferase [Acidobacteria bacterium]|nr:ACP S-malonyltransferase [Acidobacteriota bacterium]
MVSAGPRRAALVFPGQGSQKVGMGKALCEAYPEARAVYERADAALGFSLSRVCFEGPEENLRLTATTQPAVLTTSLAALETLRARCAADWNGMVACAAGHSLGEYAALVAAGALDLEDAVRTVRSRGEYMQEAVPVGRGAMAAVVGVPLKQVEDLCRDARGGEVLGPANLNAPDQTVVAGTAAAVDRLASLAKSGGAAKVIRLPVSAPFHCTLMSGAQGRLAEDLKGLRLRDAAFPVLLNVSGSPERKAETFRDALLRQVTAPVRWVDTVRAFRGLGAGTQVEVGPGRVLSGLARRIDPDLELLSVEDPASLEKTIAGLAAAKDGWQA